MRSKVAILTASVLCVILFVLDTFIYFTLYHHLVSAEENALVARAQSVVQDYSNNYNEENGTMPPLNSESSGWLRKYLQFGETILLLDAHGNPLVHFGHDSESTLVREFHAVSHPNRQIVQLQNDHDLFVSMPAVDPDSNKLVGYVILQSNIPNVKEYMKTLLTLLILGSLGAVVLAALAGYIVSSIAVRPLNQMIWLVQRLQANHLSERVQVPHGKDEIARLASTFNSMLNRIERSFTQQSQFVADASHEIRTPLTTIQGYADVLSRWGKHDPSVLDEGLHVIQKESSRLRSLAEDLLTLASLEALSTNLPRLADIDAIMRELIDSTLLIHPATPIEACLEASHPAAAAPVHVKQVMTNLLENAVKYSPPGNTVHLSTQSDDETVKLMVEDEGIGIPKDDLPHIFDRFYRVDKSRGRREGGTGLGLSIVKELVELYDGSIAVDSTPGKGTKFTVRLPVARHSTGHKA